VASADVTSKTVKLTKMRSPQIITGVLITSGGFRNHYGGSLVEALLVHHSPIPWIGDESRLCSLAILSLIFSRATGMAVDYLRRFSQSSSYALEI
jgi:hypothetical protein